VADFWEMTPRETFAAIDAAVWRDEQQQRQAITAAWLMAKLSRAKRVPSLSSVLSQGRPAKPLRGRELVERRKEFKQLASPANVALINAHMSKLAIKKVRR